MISLARHLINQSAYQAVPSFVRKLVLKLRDFVSACFRFVHSLGPSCICLLLRQFVNFASLDSSFAYSLNGQIVSSMIREIFLLRGRLAISS